MLEVLKVIALGAVQALTEFFPVSSSAHLALLGPVLGSEESSLTFDVGLHAGTATAVLVYFWREWRAIVGATLSEIWARSPLMRWSPFAHLGVLVVLGTLPAMVVGALLGNVIEEQLRAPESIAVMLVLGAIALALADRSAPRVSPNELTYAGAIAVGAAQALALVPGVSRSGITIAASRALGLDRPASVRFSFLLSTPVIFGALFLQFGKTFIEEVDLDWALLLLGAGTAFVLGLATIRVLLAFVAKRTFVSFVWYRVGLAIVVFTASAFGLLDS